jgi:type III pantothenate kinase
MLLAIDIGNTNISCGLFQKKRMIKRFSFSTQQAQYYLSLKKNLGKIIPQAVLVSSVVPKATTRLELALRFLKVKNILILGKNVAVPIKNRYQYPKQVGQDRLVSAFAAVKLHGAPAIVVDFGTAVTFDAISPKGEYLGGLILPGLEISLIALAEKTALLPKIKLSAPKGLIGRSTKNSILNGMVYGFAGLSDTLIDKLKSKLNKDTKVIATGGNIKFIAKYCRNFDLIDINLTLKGLNLIYLLSKKHLD